MGVERSEGQEGAQRMGEGRQAGWKRAGLEPHSAGPDPSALLEGLGPQPSPQASYHHAATGSSRKQLNPMYFYTQHTPGQRPGQIVRSLCAYRGRMRYTWGKGLNTNKVAPSAHATEAACANYRQKSLAHFVKGTKLAGKHHEKQQLPS